MPPALWNYVPLFLKATDFVVVLESTELWITSFKSKEVVPLIFLKKEGQWATTSKHFFAARDKQLIDIWAYGLWTLICLYKKRNNIEKRWYLYIHILFILG